MSGDTDAADQLDSMFQFFVGDREITQGIGGDGVEMTAREGIKVEGFTVDTQFQPIEANSKGPRCALARPDQERV